MVIARLKFGNILRMERDWVKIKKSSLKNELLDYCWPTRTRTLNKTTKMSCVTITPSAKTVNSGAKVMVGRSRVKFFRKKIKYFLAQRC